MTSALRGRWHLVLPLLGLIISLPLLLTPAAHPSLRLIRIGLLVSIVLAVPLLYWLRTLRELSEQRAWRLVWLLMVGFAVAMLLVAWMQVRYLHGLAIDTGIFTNVLYNTQHGHFFYCDNYKASHFAVHNSPILFLSYLIYLLVPGHWPMIILVILGLAASALVVYQIVRNWLAPGPSVVMTAAYLFNPVIISQAMPEFHEMNLAPLPLALTLYYFLRQRFGLYMLWFAVLLTIKESMAITCFMLAAAALVSRRRWWWLAIPAIAAVGWGIISLDVVIPHFSTGDSAKVIERLFGQKTIAGAVAYMLTHPLAVARHVGIKQLAHAYLMVVTWGGVPLLVSAYSLLAVPHLALLLVMENYFTLHLWDSSLFGPVLALATAHGIHRLQDMLLRRWGERPRALPIQMAGLALCLGLGSCFVWLHPADFQKPANLEAIKHAIRLVPDEVPLTVTAELMSYLHKREILRPAPFWYAETQPYSEYLLIVWDDANREYLLNDITNRSKDRLRYWDELIRALSADEKPCGYELIFAQDDVYLARRGKSPADPEEAVQHDR